MTHDLLSVEDLSVSFALPRLAGRRKGRLVAVGGVSLRLADGETLALVGESGSGKSTVARSIAGLIRPDAGRITLDGNELGPLRSRTPVAQRSIQMVFQDPRSSLNPRMSVRSIIREAWKTHPSVVPVPDREEALHKLLHDVGLGRELAARRPRDLSGGQCQRVSIARSLALNPRLLICDEAVSALDVSVQSQVLRLLIDIREERGLSLLFITHDLGVVRQIADRVAVMQGGKIVETRPADDLFTAPAHPYTRRLLDAALDIEPGPAGRTPMSHPTEVHHA